MLLACLLVTISSLDCIIVKATKKSKTETEERRRRKPSRKQKLATSSQRFWDLEAFLSSDLQRQAPSSCVIIISIQLRASSCRLVLLLQQQPEAFVSSGFCFDEPPRCILHKTSQILEACGETKKKKQQKPPLTRRRPCAGQQKPHDLPNAMHRKLLLCTHTHPPLRAPVSTNALLLRRQEMVEFRASAESLSLSLSLSQINTLISLSLSGQHPNQTRERNFDIRCSLFSMFFLFLKSLVGYQRRNIPAESIKARCAQAIALLLFFLFLLRSSCSSSSSSLLHQGIPHALVAEARSFLWTCDAFTGLMKERSFVRSFICCHQRISWIVLFKMASAILSLVPEFRGLFCSRWHQQSFLWFQNSSSCCKHLLLLLLAYLR